MDREQILDQYVVVVKHSGFMSSDRDKPSVVYGPTSKNECEYRRDQINAYNNMCSTSWAAVMKATVILDI
jgi:hypothetical protein